MKTKRSLSKQYSVSTAEVSSQLSIPKEVLTQRSDVSNGSLNVPTNASRLDQQSSKCLPGCWACAFFSVPLNLPRDRCSGVYLHVVYFIRAVSLSCFPLLTGPKSKLKSSMCPCSHAVLTTLHACVADS